MDTGEGYLEMLDQKQVDRLIMVAGKEGARVPPIFSLDEIVYVKGSRFKIKKITPKGLTLRVLPKEQINAMGIPVEDLK